MLATRKPGTTRRGESFDHSTLSAVWWKSREIPGQDPMMFRKDVCGAIIRWADHGNTNSIHGWEVDHIVAVANGGTDDPGNLQPLQWRNNRTKGDGRADAAYCVVR